MSEPAAARAAELRAQLAQHDYRYYVLDDPTVAGGDDGRGLLIAVTERRTRDEIDGFVAAFEKVTR